MPVNSLALAPTALPDAEPLEYLRAAVAAGYDGVGLRLFRSPGLPFHPVVGNAPLVREMTRVLADANLPVLDILSFYLLPETDVDQFTAALALGAELGGGYAMAIGDDPEWTRLRDNLGRLCDAAARFGLTIVIEFVPHRALATLPMALQILAETGRSASTRSTSPDRAEALLISGDSPRGSSPTHSSPTASSVRASPTSPSPGEGASGSVVSWVKGRSRFESCSRRCRRESHSASSCRCPGRCAPPRMSGPGSRWRMPETSSRISIVPVHADRDRSVEATTDRREVGR